MKRTRGTLTLDNQPAHILPVAYDIFVWFGFEEVRRVRPVKRFIFVGVRMVPVEDGQVGREPL